MGGASFSHAIKITRVVEDISYVTLSSLELALSEFGWRGY